MYAVKHSVRNFQLCQKILELYKQQGNDMPGKQMQKFIVEVDRYTLRRTCHFKPFQQLMMGMTPRLVNQSSLSANVSMLSKTTAIYGHLNVLHDRWMQHVAQITLATLKKMELLQISMVYKTFIELHCHSFTQFMTNLRQTFLAKILNITPYKSQQTYDLIRLVEVVHKYLRVYMLDPASNKQAIVPIINRLSETFQYRKPAFSFQHHPYDQSGFFYQLLLVYGIQKLVSNQFYRRFLEACYEQNRRGSENVQQNSKKEFQRRGESVFEIRFQRHLQENGYWFQRNKKIGMREFDIVLKGKIFQHYRPFSGLDYEAVINGTASAIGKDQLSKYQRMNHLWVIQQYKKWPADKIVNLNGPYHYIVGHSSGLIRSEQIKTDIIRHYGYSDFIAVDYQQWERQTENKKAVRIFFKKYFGQ